MTKKSYMVYKNLILRLEDRQLRGIPLTHKDKIQLKSAKKSVARYEAGRGAL